MSQWPEATLGVLKEIHLDPKNVRLEITNAKVEADIIEDLFANEDALGLVEGICKIGYLTHDTPVVLRRRGKYVMVEGNRRLAALKAIQNPMLVPDFQARIASLAALLPDRSLLAKIRVIIAPNQTEVDQLVAAIHTRNLRRAWPPGRQAAFFQAQIDTGRKLKELLVRYPTIDVRKFVFRANIINVFKSVDYDDVEFKEFLTTKLWAKGLSTIARIYESKDFAVLTGLSMDSDGKIFKTVSDAAFKEIATAIVRGMYDGNINTRSLNSVRSPRYIQLLAELKRIIAGMETAVALAEGTSDTHAPPPSSSQVSKAGVGGNTASAGAVGLTSEAATSRSSEEKASSSNSTSASQRNRRNRQKTLDLGQIKAPDSYPEALKLLLGELSEIDVQKFPNATFLMTRAVLEKSIKSFAEVKSKNIKNSGRVQLAQALVLELGHLSNSMAALHGLPQQH